MWSASEDAALVHSTNAGLTPLQTKKKLDNAWTVKEIKERLEFIGAKSFVASTPMGSKKRPIAATRDLKPLISKYNTMSTKKLPATRGAAVVSVGTKKVVNKKIPVSEVSVQSPARVAAKNAGRVTLSRMRTVMKPDDSDSEPNSPVKTAKALKSPVKVVVSPRIATKSAAKESVSTVKNVKSPAKVVVPLVQPKAPIVERRRSVTFLQTPAAKQSVKPKDKKFLQLDTPLAFKTSRKIPLTPGIALKVNGSKRSMLSAASDEEEKKYTPKPIKRRKIEVGSESESPMITRGRSLKKETKDKPAKEEIKAIEVNEAPREYQGFLSFVFYKVGRGLGLIQ